MVLFAPIIALCALLTSCTSASSSAALEDSSWCAQVQHELREIHVAWPVASTSLATAKIAGIEDVFERYAGRAEGDLGIAVRGWLQGFKAAAPYLETNDPQGFSQNVSEPLREQLHLANVTINNICHWDSWK
jgi:hypothetical protein